MKIGDYISILNKGRYLVVEVRPSEKVMGRISPRVVGYSITGFLNPRMCKVLKSINLENE